MTAAREGQAASRSGSGLGRAAEGGVEVGIGGSVEVGVGGGVESGVEGGVEAGERAAADGRRQRRQRRSCDLGEVAVGENESSGLVRSSSSAFQELCYY